MLDTLTMLNPLGISWASWAGGVAQDLSPVYNIPNPGEEDLWQQWATELLNIDAVAELGVPDPRGFQDWRQWAARFIMAST